MVLKYPDDDTTPGIKGELSLHPDDANNKAVLYSPVLEICGQPTADTLREWLHEKLQAAGQLDEVIDADQLDLYEDKNGKDRMIDLNDKISLKAHFKLKVVYPVKPSAPFSNKRKFASSGTLQAYSKEILTAKALVKLLKASSLNVADLSNPKTTTKVPFLSIFRPAPERIKLSDQCITFFGRTDFASLVHEIQMLGQEQPGVSNYARMLISGIVGGGQSYMLVSAASMLQKQFLEQNAISDQSTNKSVIPSLRVVYVPDCGALLIDLVSEMRQSLLLAFIEDEEAVHRITMLRTQEEITAWLSQVDRMLFIFDQVNKLSGEEGRHVRGFVDVLGRHHCVVDLWSICDPMGIQAADKQTNIKPFHVLGELNDDEWAAWCSITKSRWPTPKQGSCADPGQEIVAYAGKIPLFLDAFLRPPGGTSLADPASWTFNKALESFLGLKEVRNMPRHIQNFLSVDTVLRKARLKTMIKCIEGQLTHVNPALLDARYFHISTAGLPTNHSANAGLCRPICHYVTCVVTEIVKNEKLVSLY